MGAGGHMYRSYSPDSRSLLFIWERIVGGWGFGVEDVSGVDMDGMVLVVVLPFP